MAKKSKEQIWVFTDSTSKGKTFKPPVVLVATSKEEIMEIVEYYISDLFSADLIMEIMVALDSDGGASGPKDEQYNIVGFEPDPQNSPEEGVWSVI